MLAVIAAGAFELRDIIGKSALDERVMTAMGKVLRHAFVPIELQPYAYENIPLPIGFAKTLGSGEDPILDLDRCGDLSRLGQIVQRDHCITQRWAINQYVAVYERQMG